MMANNSVETETYTLNQIRYKTITGVTSIEDVMERLLEGNNPDSVKKIVIQPRTYANDFTNDLQDTENPEDLPWIQNRPWTEHNRIDSCLNP